MAMHEDQLQVDADLVRRLVAQQFPEWAGEPVRAVTSDATVNAIFRVGESRTARLPLRAADPASALAVLTSEAAAMGELAACCPFPTPLPIAVGRPGEGYPLPWSVQTWVAGSVATPDGLASSPAFADDLADLLGAFRAVDTRGRSFSGDGRGGNLQDSDGWMETCFRESAHLLAVDRLRVLWTRFRVLPAGGPDVMSHGDLTPANLLVDAGRLSGVLDCGGFAPADPALDLVCAWHLLDHARRKRLRGALRSDPVEWRRGAAWAFQQAMGLVWYYRSSNPGMSELGRSTLARILADPDL